MGATLSKMGTCTLDAMGSRQFWPQWTVQWNFARDRIFCQCGPGVGMPARLALVVDHSPTDRRVARPHQARRRLHHLRLVGSRWPAGAAHIVAVLQGDAVGSVGSQRAL